MTTAAFGAGITVNSVTVSGPTSATVSLSIAGAAALGARTVTMTTGAEVASLAGGFTVIAGTPDLTLTKSHTGAFTQGQTGATYTLTVTNSGAGPTSGLVTVTDTLPAGLTATALSGTGWTCTLATVTCTRSDVLAAAASYPALTLTVTVATTAPASVTNTASVSGGGELNTANNTASDVTAITPPVADLSLTKTVSDATPPVGSTTIPLNPAFSQLTTDSDW